MNAKVDALYETLARYEWWRRRRGSDGLELRKRLRPAATAPTDGGEAFDRWLFDLVGPPRGATIVDFGCGFGASLLRWVEWSEGDGLGITTSGYQASRLREVAARRGLASDVRVLVQDFAVPTGVRADAALAIEALGHASQLDAALANVHASLRPGGTFVWVEDLLASGEHDDDEDVCELARRWASPPLRSRAATADAAARRGLPVRLEFDLTARVVAGEAGTVARRTARLLRWRAMVPFRPWHRLADAFLGGSALERLYARGEACYVARICERIDVP